jgi:poly-gamma-glutamate capsule biosynthesis protein CapA/YwtB (metallophosphatase superfamily)
VQSALKGQKTMLKARRRMIFGLAGFIIVCAAVFFVRGNLDQFAADSGEARQNIEEVVNDSASSRPQWTMTASGDVMLGRRVAEAMACNGALYPFAAVATLLRSADLTFGNLESPLSKQGTPLPGKGIWLRGDPSGAAALSEVGYDVMSVANNHILDYDDPAFLDTLTFLNEQGIIPVGGGTNLAMAAKPVFREVKGQQIAFLAATEMADIFWDWDYPRTFEAKPDRPGVYKLDPDQLVDDVSSLRGKADLIVVSLHWGTEYSDYATEDQRKIAHRLVDAGANLIIGHHPHCLQGVELYQGAVIAYSLGNFVYDRQRRPKCQESLLLKAFFEGRSLKKVYLYPVIIDSEQPRLAGKDAAAKILQRTTVLCQGFNTSLVVNDGIGIIECQCEEMGGENDGKAIDS